MATASIRLDAILVNRARVVGEANSRSTAKQIEYWAKIGKIMENNPDLPYQFVRDAMISKVEKEAGMVEEYRFG